MRPRAVVLAVCLAATLLPAPPAAAKSTVSFDGTVATLHVPVDLIGMANYDFWDPDTEDFTKSAEDALQPIQDKANAMWNDQLADLSFLDCFTFRVNIELFPRPSGYAGTEGHHRIEYKIDPTLRSHVDWPPGAPATGDASTMFEGSAGGKWSHADVFNPWVVAHESGHLLGLDDDYTDVGGVFRDVKSVPKPGREGTMMNGGTAVDQDLVDRLGKLVDEVEDLPECWIGMIESDTTRVYTPGGGTCTDGWRSELAFTVRDGVVNGSATMELVSGPECTFPVSLDPEKLIPLGVLGDATDGEFRLQLEGGENVAGAVWAGSVTLYVQPGCPFPSTPGPTITVPRTREGEARVEVELSAPLGCAGSVNDTFTSSNTIELQQVTVSGP